MHKLRLKNPYLCKIYYCHSVSFGYAQSREEYSLIHFNSSTMFWTQDTPGRSLSHGATGTTLRSDEGGRPPTLSSLALSWAKQRITIKAFLASYNPLLTVLWK